MTSYRAPVTKENVTSLLIAVLATALLLIVNAPHLSAQTIASNNAANIAAANVATVVAANTGSASRSDTTPVARGKTRITWPKATRVIQRGETLKASDFVLVDTVISWAWKDAPTDTMTAVTGWIARRLFAEGEFMHGPSIAPGSVITLGSTVKVLFQDGPVHLTLTGTATNNAALGAPVGVRLDKNRRLDGIAVGPNTVRIR